MEKNSQQLQFFCPIIFFDYCKKEPHQLLTNKRELPGTNYQPYSHSLFLISFMDINSQEFHKKYPFF